MYAELKCKKGIQFFLRCRAQKRRTGRLSFLSVAESTVNHVHTGRGAFTQIASYRGCVVAVKVLRKKHIEVSRLGCIYFVQKSLVLFV